MDDFSKTLNTIPGEELELLIGEGSLSADVESNTQNIICPCGEFPSLDANNVEDIILPDLDFEDLSEVSCMNYKHSLIKQLHKFQKDKCVIC